MNSSDVQIVFPEDSDHLRSGYNVFVMVAFSFSLSQYDVDDGMLMSQTEESQLGINEEVICVHTVGCWCWPGTWPGRYEFSLC